MKTWPGVTWGVAQWRPRPDVPSSRRAARRNTGEFRYAQPARIASLQPDLEPDLREDLRRATATLERFDESAKGWGPPFAAVLLRSESAASSQIEQLTASARRVAMATLGVSSHPNATQVARNVDAMSAAVAVADRMDVAAILEMHGHLGGGTDPANAGRLREEWVWVGGESPVTAMFVAPPAPDVPDAMDDLVSFLRRDDMDPLVQAALGHAQFETIHPFTDGNGRCGRALVSAVLRRRGVTPTMSVPVSSGLLTDTGAYFGALTAYRDGDISPILEAFAMAAERAVSNAALLRQDVVAVRDAVLATARRRSASLDRLAEVCSTEPAFTVAALDRAGIPRATAYRLVASLVEAGILRSEGKVHGREAWSVPPLTQALDDFAARAGRRMPA